MPAPASPKPGPRMNAREKTNRDNQIVAARMRGLSGRRSRRRMGSPSGNARASLEDFRRVRDSRRRGPADPSGSPTHARGDEASRSIFLVRDP